MSADDLYRKYLEYEHTKDLLRIEWYDIFSEALYVTKTAKEFMVRSAANEVIGFYPQSWKETDVWQACEEYIQCLIHAVASSESAIKAKRVLRALYEACSDDLLARVLKDAGVDPDTIEVVKEKLNHAQFVMKINHQSYREYKEAHERFFGGVRLNLFKLAQIEYIKETSFKKLIKEKKFGVNNKRIMFVKDLTYFEILAGNYSDAIKMEVFRNEDQE